MVAILINPMKIWGVAGILTSIPLAAVVKIILQTYDRDFMAALIFEPYDSSEI